MPDDRLLAVPDTDGELGCLREALEETLISLVGFGDDPNERDLPEPPLGDGSALRAVERVAATVRGVERAATPQPVAPDGRFELIPLRFVHLGADDLAVIGEAVAALGRALLPGGDDIVASTLNDRARSRWRPGTDDRGTTRPAAGLIDDFARAHGLLDLTPNDDTVMLAGRLAGRAGPVVLSGAEHDAYQRLTERAIAMFYLGDPLARFLYRG